MIQNLEKSEILNRRRSKDSGFRTLHCIIVLITLRLQISWLILSSSVQTSWLLHSRTDSATSRVQEEAPRVQSGRPLGPQPKLPLYPQSSSLPPPAHSLPFWTAPNCSRLQFGARSALLPIFHLSLPTFHSVSSRNGC